MAFAVVCKSCQARFLLNDDLLRRKVAGRVVTVRCRQCHATIEVDASDVDTKKLAEVGRAPQALAAPPASPTTPDASATETPKPKAPRPAPSPPRPPAKSTLMGIGAPKPPDATELVALSPGLLSVGRAAPAAKLAPEGFPEPPPPPPQSARVELLDESDWEVQETPMLAKAEPAPESVDDFIEELPPSLPPEEELPSSTGTPSLWSLTQHDEPRPKPRVDDFLANMTAATNGGIAPGAPTIDVSSLGVAPESDAADDGLDDDPTRIVGPESRKKTLPLFALPGAGETEPAPRRVPAPPAKDPTRGGTQPMQVPEGSLSPAALETTPPVSERPDSKRERRNVVAPATKSIPPAPPEKQRSLLAAPLLLALAAAAGFLIYKRATPASDPPRAEVAAPPVIAAAPEPSSPVAPTPSVSLTTAPEPVAAAEELTFETAKPAVAAPAPREPLPAVSEPKPAPKSETPAEAAIAPVVEQAKPAPSAREPAAEPTGPFDRAAAGAALTASASQASSCRKEGDPSGVASVVVTFAPSGRVTSATISGPPFAGTPTGGCIASTLRKARVPAFDGDRVTVSKTVVIQ